MYITRNTNKIKILLEQEKRIFSSSDLSVLWSSTNKNTLLTTIKRYIARDILYPISKGLYSTMPLEKLDPYELGCALSGPYSYVSAESVLQTEGIIMQNVNKITLFGQKTKEIYINNHTFLCRYLNVRYLLNREGIITNKCYAIANKNRAIADILHLNPKYHFDNQMAIDMDQVNFLNKKIGYL